MRWICLSWGVWRLIRRRNCSHCWWVCFGRPVPIPLPSSVLSTSGERKIGRVPPEVVKIVDVKCPDSGEAKCVRGWSVRGARHLAPHLLSKAGEASLQVESPQAGLRVLPASVAAGILIQR